MAKKGMLIKSAIAAAVGLTCSQAFAQATGNIAAPVTATNFAKQIFGGTGPALSLTLPTITYATNSPAGITINPTACVDLYLTLTGGTWTAAPAAGDISFAAWATPPVFVGANRAAGNQTIIVRVQNTAVTPIVAGLGAQVSVNPASALIAGGSTLASGGSITVSGGLNNPILVGAACTAPTATEAAVASRNLELNSPPKTIANTSDAVKVTTVESGSFPLTPPAGTAKETAVIDVVTASPAGSVFVSGVNAAAPTTTVNLGAIKIEPVAGVKDRGGANDFVVGGAVGATNDGTGTATVTIASTSGSFLTTSPASALLTLKAAANCTGAAVGTASNTTATGATISAIPATAYAAAAPLFVCYDVSGVPVASRNIPVVTSTAQTTVAPDAVRPGLSGSAFTGSAGALYALKQNGKTVDVINYLPAAIPSGAFQTFIRVANAGSSSGQLQVSLINASGATSAAANVTQANGCGVPACGGFTGVLAAGQSVSLTSGDVEAALAAAGVAAPAAGDRPRVRFSGPFGRLQVQAYIRNPDGSFTNMSPDYDTATGATQP